MAEQTATAEAETLETVKPTESQTETGTESTSETVADSSTETDSAGQEKPEGTQEPKPEDEKAKQEAIRKRKAEKKQRHINKLTREKLEAQAEAKRLREELEIANKTREPKPEDFDNEADYIDAVVNYRVEQSKPKPEPPPDVGPDYQSIIQAGKEKFPDFEQVAMNQQLNLTKELAETIALADNADEIFYHLGNDPVELERISLLDPRSMAREIGRLEATVSMPPPKTSKAPEPVKPLETNTSTDVDESKLSMEEWAKRRNADQWKKGKI